MDWLWRIHDLGLIEEEDLDREAGRLYGFNKCCIDNYISISKKGIRDVARRMMKIYGPDEELLKSLLNNPHVRCAKCRKLGR
jgi:hypothetical protein